MIDFSTLKGLTIPEGVVVKIEKDGQVMWTRSDDASSIVSLEVAKITSDTYANETTYTGEQFILLDIYPKTNGTVSITYGDLTKTITDTSGEAEPAAQSVYFGTFNGVSDSVETPTSGELTISGDYRAFGVGNFNPKKGAVSCCGCITKVNNFGQVEYLPVNAFSLCEGLTDITIPDSVTSIEENIFYGCEGLTSITLPNSVKSIGENAFAGCTSLTSITIPNSVTSIQYRTFYNCDGLTSITIPDSVLSIMSRAFEDCGGLTSVTMDTSRQWYYTVGSSKKYFYPSDPETNAHNFVSGTYLTYDIYRIGG